MQFKVKSNEQTNRLSQNHWLVPRHAMDRLIGKTCRTIEMAGLPQKQEEALKEALKEEIYSCFSRDGGALYVDNDLSSSLWYLDEKERNYAMREGVLISGKGNYEITKTIPEPELPPTEE